jgi:hypothetical protein
MAEFEGVWRAEYSVAVTRSCSLRHKEQPAVG